MQTKRTFFPFYHLKRRYFLLLEVLISLAFVTIAIIPLLYPHFFIYQQQRSFINKIDIDIAVNEFYGKIVEQLQQSQISWEAIEQQHAIPITEQFWSASEEYRRSPPFTGAYRFRIVKSKKNDQYGLYLLELTIVVDSNPKSHKTHKMLTYTYQIFATRLFSIG